MNSTMFRNRFAQALNRKIQGHSLRLICRQTKIAVMSMERYRDGKGVPRLDSMFLLWKFAGISVEELFKEIDDGTSL